MQIRAHRRDRVAVGSLLAPILLAAGFAPAAPVDPPARADKISPGVLWRQSVQERYALDRSERTADRLLALGMTVTDLDELHCVVYVERPFSDQQLDQLRFQGVAILPTTYAPPVPGRHPYGAYLADIDHTAFNALRANPQIKRVDAAPRALRPLNDIAGEVTDAQAVRQGKGVSQNTGAGVTIAIADTGIDLTHPDFPPPVEAYDLTDGDSPATWGLDVSNTVSGHGTHVAGSALGRGAASDGAFMGSAPGADLVFYKIGSDDTGGALLSDIAEAMSRANSIGCDIFSLSFGGISDFLDGSEFLEQVCDVAYLSGMLVFSSAGNAGDDMLHITVDVPAKGTSEVIRFEVDNEGFDVPFNFFEFFQINWIDSPGDANLRLVQLFDPEDTSSLERLFYDFSLRGTELEVSQFNFIVAPDTLRTYEFVIENSADVPVTAQLYANIGLDAHFPDADPGYTISSPALADTTIAVGSVNHRISVRNYLGNQISFSNFAGEPFEVSNFSSRGPRIDGLLKPDIVAPGAMMVSCRDSVPGLTDNPTFIIDNDGENLDGSGPAQYYLNAGTSMACPTAAGAAALLFEAHPYLDTAAMRDAILKNATRAGAPDNDWGHGLISARSSILNGPATGVVGDLDGDSRVGIEDLAILIDEFSGDDDLADINNDRVVDTADLGIMIRNFGAGAPPAP